MKYLPDELKKLSPPNDVDILVESRQAINYKNIGDYIKVQSTLKKCT